jgi:hypothetical protein
LDEANTSDVGSCCRLLSMFSDTGEAPSQMATAQALLDLVRGPNRSIATDSLLVAVILVCEFFFAFSGRIYSAIISLMYVGYSAMNFSA